MAGFAVPVSLPIGGVVATPVGAGSGSAGLGGPLGGGIGSAGLGGPLGAGASPIPSLPELIGLSVGGWVLSSAKFALNETDKVLERTTTPQLRSTWFSATYWHMAAIAAVLTLPFLFAAAVQALIRSDLALLVRAAFGYLPLAMLAIAIAAPLTMLILAASDELSRAVSAASGGADASFLARAATLIGGLSAADQSPFLAFLVGGLTVAGAVVLWMELLMREAAVYVVVLMLPLAFSALVWPARRMWATRAVELLVALVLSKFAIVAVLSLGGAAMSASLGTADVEAWLAGLVLLVMAAFTPWALLRFVPVAELAAGAVGGLRHDVHRNVLQAEQALDKAWRGPESAKSAMAGLRRDAEAADLPPRPAAAAGGDSASGGQSASGGETDAAGGAGEAEATNGSEPWVDGDESSVGVDAVSTTAVDGDATGAIRGEATASTGHASAPGFPNSPDVPTGIPIDHEADAAATRDQTPDLVAGFTSVEQLDHKLDLGIGKDGTPAWRASRPTSGQSSRAHGQPPTQNSPEADLATPTAQPPEDGRL